MDGFHKKKLLKDLFFLSISFFVAVVLVRSGLVHELARYTDGWGFLGVFIAGMGFSSAFTTAPAIVILFELAEDFSPIWLFVIIAALGAMTTDLIIFRFLRDGLDEDITYLVEHSTNLARFRATFHSRLFYWFGTLVAALVIASPLPDELGLALFGLLRLDKKKFIPVSLFMNSIGIFIIALAARLITN